MVDKDLYDIIFFNTEMTEENEEKDRAIEKQTEKLYVSTSDSIKQMKETSNNPSWREIPLFPKPFGRLAKIMKRNIRKLTKFYIEPYAEQQNRFNSATTEAIDKLAQNTGLIQESLLEKDYSIIAIKQVLEIQNANQIENQKKINSTQETQELQNKKIDMLLTEQNESKKLIQSIEETQDLQNKKIDMLLTEQNESKKLIQSIEETQMFQNEKIESIQLVYETQLRHENQLDILASSQSESQKAVEELQKIYNLLDDGVRQNNNSIIAIKNVLDNHNETFSSIKNVIEKQNAQLIELQSLRSELERAFSSISSMEDYILKTKKVINDAHSIGMLSYSQSGEDGIIHYILRYLQKPVNAVHYLDLGANHAKEISNTYSLYEQGARGVLLEANPYLISELRLFRSEDIIIPKCLVSDTEIKHIPFYVLNGDGLSSFDKSSVDEALDQNPSLKISSIVEVETITIDEIIKRYFPVAPTVLNIDIEGTEEEILNAIDFEAWRPLIIIIETIPYHPYLVHDEKREDLVKMLTEKDYTEYAFTGINSIMLDKRQLN